MRKRMTLFLVILVGAMLLVAPAAMAAINVTSMGVDHAYNGTSVSCIVYGSFLHPTGTHTLLPTFQLVNGATTIPLTTTSILEATGGKAYVTFAIPVGAALGAYTLNATQLFWIDGGLLGWIGPFPDIASLASAFTVEKQPPVITSLNPPSVVAGGGDLTLTVYGDYFFSMVVIGDSHVRFNGANVATVYNSPTVLTATIPAASVATPGSAAVTVHNPGFMLDPGQTSDPFTFTITAPGATISALDPASAVVGGPAFNLGVTGTSFVTGATGAVVRWNGTDLVTTRDSATHLTAAVPAARIAAVGSATITVRNGTAPAAPISNALTFTIGNLVPALTTISPTQVWAGYVKNDVVLTVNGSNFVSGARIVLSGGEKTGTTFVNATQLTVPLVAADISTPTTLMVSVKNPPFPPGVSSAGALPLVVAAETTDPAVSISGADAGWHNTAVPLTFVATDGQSGVQKIQYQSPPTVAAWTDGASYTVPVTTQGSIAVNVQALDWCNRVGTAGATVNIDTTQPETAALGNVSVRKGKTANLKYRITEPAGLSPKAKVVIKIKRANGTTAKTATIRSAPTNAKRTYSFKCKLAKGTYKWYVYATDLAGNIQENVATASLKVK
jgi:hypothetical protein